MISLCNLAVKRRYHERVNRHAIGTRRRWLAVAILAANLAAAGACRAKEPPRPITYDGTFIVVHNLSQEEWRHVEIWLNYYYRVTRDSMPPGTRLTIPLNTFVAGYGQRFDARRQVVQTIEVKATAWSGKPVSIMYGGGPRK